MKVMKKYLPLRITSSLAVSKERKKFSGAKQGQLFI
jgi:hypothetical protein